ncbi:MAG: hypothetical protein IJY08_05695 [Clostridia bacterium]|nr:hypothetical protein [Clostridia bacterium]
MKRYITILLCAVLCISLLAGCSKKQNKTPPDTPDIQTEPPVTGTHVIVDPTENKLKIDHILSWEGEFSEDKYFETIKKFSAEHTSVLTEKEKQVYFLADSDVQHVRVIRVAPVDDSKFNIELNGYIDLTIKTEHEGKTVTFDTDWWYSENDDRPVWSYLFEVTGNDNSVKHYYTRLRHKTENSSLYSSYENPAFVIERIADGKLITMSDTYRETVREIWSASEWTDKDINNCGYDYIIHVGDKSHYYHTDCANFTQNGVGVTLDKDDQVRINTMIKNIFGAVDK